ncbi:MAG: hypothetical protein IJZ17_05255 [Muribaculaceae bacterium]|nr:hypothetical protein [Muribaculaceae bacterium]
MNVDINKLIEISCELEGLLLLAREREANIPDDVWRLVKNKITLLDELISQREMKESSIVDCDVVAPVDNYDENHECQESEVEKGSRWEGGSAIFDDKTGGDDMPDFEMTFDVVTDAVVDKVHVDSKCCNPESYAENEAVASNLSSTVITLDEKLARDTMRDLRKAFSINDRYRFRRELFGNNEADMTDAINLVSAMTSMSEAEDYFYNDMEWDSDNEEVKDFMEIVARYFYSK